jgi:hypothetical protein
VLRAPFALEYTYTRSVGPVLGRFFAGLRDAKVLGARTKSGRVLVPPAEYDPETSDSIGPDALVEVASEGEIVTWSWVTAPHARQPLDRPFAWALIRLDGADTALLHVVDAPSEASLHSGLRVRVRWAPERKGFITDIACFEPVPS